MPSTSLDTDQLVQAYHRDGYGIVPGLFSQEEMDLLLEIGQKDRMLAEKTRGRKDASGAVTKLYLDAELHEDDVYSAIARSRRIVEPMQSIFGKPIVHFHHKMMQKEPYTGGAWEWHQDYGYWYRHEGFLWPETASCLVAVTPADKNNGCLQVLKGSHKAGRIEHGDTGDQTGAHEQRVRELEKELETVYCELNPGDAVFFDGNTLHRSDQNTSEHPRWSLISCYVTEGNRAVNKTDHLVLTPIEPLDDNQVIEVARRHKVALESTTN